jgi:uridine kinase
MFGGVEAARRAFDARYHAACRRYLAEVAPATHATVVIGNDDLANPELRRSSVI